ncbi:sensor histidine kinase [Stappia indica]|uniref:sensor histidine kinase n=1 Tax=Stappia indica TaxID=538381 RepID=UPI001CD49993|nr:sensor histidine kinase [Stappia indica]MCA1299639.1 sensor histidine kinase N-terminal domain-containing protein [Stappia indica]
MAWLRPQAPRSLSTRLLLWLLVPLSLLAGLGLVDAYREARATANAVLDRVLTGSALAIAERVAVNSEGELEVDVPYVALEMLTSAAEDRVFYKVEGPPGTFVTGYRQLPVPETAPTARMAHDVRFADAVFRGAPVRIAILSGAAASRDRSISFRVSVAETTTARRALARDILLRTALRQVLLIVIAATAVFLGIRRALRPLARLEEAIDRRSPDDLRPIRHQVPREVGRLVGAINGFMLRLSEALAALRRFTGNASHQIRTPLTVIRTQIELARRAEDRQTALAALDVADQAVAQSERTLAQLLVLARVDEASADRMDTAPLDLAALARQVTGELEPGAARAGLDLGFEAPEGERVPVRGNAMLLRELLRNLIENTIAYAGAGCRATVRVGVEGKAALLEVEDNGPGIDAAARARALMRFERLSAEGPQGAGLGLAIVDEIARLMGARMALQDGRDVPEGGDGRGLRVCLRFPLADRPAAAASGA